LTEETRKNFIKQARTEAEKGRVSVRNIRRDANGTLKDLLKDKEISEDEQRGAEDQIQNLTENVIAQVDRRWADKEKDLMQV
jgi:ribosome recycling factor